MNQTRLSLQWLISAGALLGTLAPCARAADPFAASVLSCAAEADRDSRLACYDRAVANFTAALPKAPEGRASPAPSAVPPLPLPSRAAAAAAPATATAGAPPSHLTAKVVSIDYVPDHMVLHLDNNQTWQQSSESSTDLNLHAGDTVTIDKQLGSYWLSGRKGAGSVQVKQKQ